MFQYPRIRSAPATLRQEITTLDTVLEEMAVSDLYQRRSNVEKKLQDNVPVRNFELGTRQNHVLKEGDSCNEDYAETDNSAGSFSGEKEALFDRPRPCHRRVRINKEPQYPKEFGKPSPGEGLRTALGNLEKRLQRSRNTSSKYQRRHEGPRQLSDGKGLAMLTEEMPQPSAKHFNKGIL